MEPHWKVVKNILCYFKHTILTGLFLHGSSNSVLQAFSNSNWVADLNDHQLVGAYCILMGNNLISCRCKKKIIIVCNSIEAKYKSLENTTLEIQWLQSILCEIDLKIPQPPMLWCDYFRATYFTTHPKFHARTKHIQIDFHYVREKVQRKKHNV